MDGYGDGRMMKTRTDDGVVVDRDKRKDELEVGGLAAPFRGWRLVMQLVALGDGEVAGPVRLETETDSVTRAQAGRQAEDG